jgi:hypothetical protein
MAAIPLHCNICPKKPNFSDVSHLLTHIASKGHLSNYYTVKVRSGSEDASRRLIEAYDQWYAEWNVEDLMSERMSQKDKRRTRARPAGTAFTPGTLRDTHADLPSVVARANPPAPPEIQAPAPRPARPRAAVSNLLDPRLSEQQLIKVERSITPTPTPQPGPVLRHRPFAPRMSYWPAGSRSTSQSYTNPDYETSSEYSEPSVRKRRYNYPVEDSCAVEDDPVDTPATTVEDPTAVSESTKLKGVYWPGMDLFDSATPEMRRKRNQKKDSSVVEQLEINSQEVEATELIFTPQGSFKRQRRISSSVYDDEESSPLRGESPVPKPIFARPALADMDANRVLRPRGNRPPALSHLARGQYDNDQGRSAHGHGGRALRSKRGFNVFQDEEVSFAQPSAFNYLTAGYHRHQESPTPAPIWPGYKAYSDAYPFDNKENVMPAYHQPAYDHHHHHQPAGYHYPAYAYGLGHDHHVFQYQDHLYLNNAYRHHHQEEADDQRTLTAPPSPSTA